MFSIHDKMVTYFAPRSLYLFNISQHATNYEETVPYIHWTCKSYVYYRQNISNHIILTINVRGYLKQWKLTRYFPRHQYPLGSKPELVPWASAFLLHVLPPRWQSVYYMQLTPYPLSGDFDHRLRFRWTGFVPVIDGTRRRRYVEHQWWFVQSKSNIYSIPKRGYRIGHFCN